MIVPATELPSSQDVRFQLFDSDGEGGWDSFGARVDVRTGVEAGVCPAQLDLPTDSGEGRRRALRNGGTDGDSGLLHGRGGGVGASTRLLLPPAATITAEIDPLLLGAEAAAAASSVTNGTGGDTPQLEAVRVAAQSLLRSELAESDPDLHEAVSLFVNLDADEG